MLPSLWTDRVTDAARVVSVRNRLAADDVADRIAATAARHARQLRDDGERGAQAAEYAMLGGVGAAACGTVVVVIQNDGPSLLSGLLSAAFRFVQGLIG